jgi:hypothetical protein
MSLISGSYSRLLNVWGMAPLLREVMVEKEEAAIVREILGFDEAVWRAIGVTALLITPDRDRRFREAVLHKMRLKADILQLAYVEPDDLNAALTRRESRTARFGEVASY